MPMLIVLEAFPSKLRFEYTQKSVMESPNRTASKLLPALCLTSSLKWDVPYSSVRCVGVHGSDAGSEPGTWTLSGSTQAMRRPPPRTNWCR